jgi:hypothetical protein
MNRRREILIWLGLAFGAVLISLLIVQISIRAAFDSSSRIDLGDAALTPQLADYSSDAAQGQQQALDPNLLTDAPAEDSLLQNAQAGRGALDLPTAQGFTNPIAVLLAPPTAIPTRLVTALPTATALPTLTSNGNPAVTATPTDLPPSPTSTGTFTATVTSLPSTTSVVRATSTAQATP